MRPSQAYFWATHNGAEIDLIFPHQGQKFGGKVKFSETPKITRSMRTARADLALDHLWVIYPGQHRYPVDENISVWPLKDVPRLPVRAG